MPDSLLGLAIPAAVVAAGWLWQRWQERTSVRVAIVAEVLALKEIAVERLYLPGLLEMADHLDSITPSEREPVKLQVRIPEHYCRVYTANISKLGYLKSKDAQLVVRFYQYADSVVQDVTAGGIIYEGTSDPETFRGAAKVLESALYVADQLALRHAKR